MKSTAIVALSIVTLVLAGTTAEAGTVTWKGITWNTYGASTTAVVNGNGGLDITVVGGEHGDPSPDNWVLKGFLPGSLTQNNAPWVEFKIKDAYAGDKNVGGPRCFIDVYNSTGKVETMWQGGILAGYSTYYLNHHVWDSDVDDFVAGDWYKGPTRSAGEHIIKMGMKTNGDVDMWFDGVLGQTISASADCTSFSRTWLGVSAQPGVTYTATYNDLQWGTGYVPEPATMSLLALGGLGLIRRRRTA